MYNILFLFCKLHTEGRGSIVDTPQQMVATYAMQANAEQFIWGPRDYVAFHGIKTT